jgi:hypothetical protein
MKYRYFVLYLMFTFFFFGCSHPTKNIELNIILCNQITTASDNHYPKDLQDICLPIEDVCKPLVSLSFFPLIAKRIDIGKESSFEYQNSKASNYDKVKAVVRDLKKYFKDSLISASLSVQTNNNFNLNSFLSDNSNKENYLIFSDDEKLPPGSKRYDNVTDLRKAIAQLVCDKNLSKIVVVYKPTSAAIVTQPVTTIIPSPVVSTTVSTPEKTTATDRVATAVSVTTDNLERYFHKLAVSGLSQQEGTIIKRKILNLFASPNVEVIQVNSDQATPTGMTIGKYVESISITHKIVTIDHKQIQNGKISEIYVSEK